MSDTASVAQVQLPGTDDIRKIVALLREDMTGEVRGEAADRLVMLAANEGHPRAKAALLERAAKLVVDSDEQRAVMLLRESFRLFPKREVGELLRDRGQDEPSLQRLGRMSQLFNAIAALHERGEAQRDALFGATAFHLAQGHGRRALETLGAVLEIGAGDRGEEAEELRKAADAAVKERDEKLGEKRQQIVEAPDEFRGQVLLEYAELLLQGDAGLGDVSAVLEDALEQGADKRKVAPLWAEVSRAVGEPGMLGRALAASIDAADKPHEKLRFADELINLPRVDQDAPEMAKTALATLLEAMPDDIRLRARYLSVRAGSGDANAAKELDELRLTAVKERDRDAEAAICLALARIASARGDLARVERHLRRVRTLDPRNADALDFFEQQYRDGGDHQKLYLVLTHRLAISSGGEVVRIALEMGELATGPLKNDERAIEAYLRALSVDADNQTAMAKLEALYAKTERWGALRELLDRRARRHEARVDSDPDAVAEASGVLERLVAMHRPDGADPDGVALFEALRRLNSIAPGHTGAATELAERYRRDGRWRHLAEVLQSQLAHVQGERQAAVAVELFEVLRNKLGDPTRAIEAVRPVMDAGAADLALLRLLQDAYRRTNDDDGYLQVLAQLRGRVENDELIRVVEEMAALTESAGAAAEAVTLYEELRGLQAGHMGAKRALTRLYGRVDRHPDLVELIEVRLVEEELDDGEKAALYETLALTIAEHLGDLKRAEDAARSLRQLQPDSEIGAEIAQRAMLGRGDFAGLRGVYAADAGGALSYVDAIREMAEQRDDAKAITALLAAAEAQADELEDPAAAAETCAEALAKASGLEDSELAVHAAQTLMLHAEAARRADLQMLGVAALIDSVGGEERLMYMAQRVALCEDSGDWDGAYAGVTALVAERLAAGDLEGMAGAADRVADLAERVGQDDELPLLFCAWADTLIGTDSEPGERDPELVTAVVELLTRAQDQALLQGLELDEVREQLEAALATCGELDELLQLRELVCTEQGDWPAVVDTLQRQAQLVEGDERVDLLLRAANRCETALTDPKKAAELYEEVVQARPESAEAWSGLLESLRAADDDAALDSASSRFLAVPVDDRPGKAVVAVGRIGYLMDQDAAADAFNQVLVPMLGTIAERDDLLDAEEGVIAIAAGRLELEQGATELATALLPAAQRHGREEEVQRCFALLGAALEPGSDERKAMLRRWAESAAASEDRDGAIAAWTLVREEEPAALDALDALELLHRDAGDHDAVALTLEERLGANGGEEQQEEREATWLRLIDIHQTERAAAEEALAAAQRAAQDLPGSGALAAIRLELLREHGDPSERLSALDERAAAEDDTELRRALQLEGASIADEQLRDDAAASERWLALLLDDPSDDDVAGRCHALLEAGRWSASAAQTEQLAEAFDVRGEHARLDAALTALVGQCEDGPKIAVLKRQAKVREESLDDRKGAFEAAAAALQLAPADEQLYETAERLAGEGDESARLSLMSARAAAETEPEKRDAALLKHARYAAELGEPDAAAESWERLLDSEDREARLEAAAALAEVREQSGDHAGHARALLVQRELAEDDESKAALAVMAAEQLIAAGNAEDAAAVLRDAEQTQPNNLAVWAALEGALRELNDQPAVIAHLGKAWRSVHPAHDDAESAVAALDEQLALLAAAEESLPARWEVVRDAVGAGLSSATLDQQIIAVAGGARELADAADQAQARLLGARHALERDTPSAALPLLDAILEAAPGHTEAFALRGAALDELTDAEGNDERIAAHYAHGLAHGADAEQRTAARLLLAEHLATLGGDPSGAFDVVRGGLAEVDKEQRSDLYRLAELYAEQAGITTTLWDLLEVEASEDSSESAQRWLSLAHKAVEHDQHHDRARKYADRAAQAGAEHELVIAVLDLVADAGSDAVDSALLEQLIAHHNATDAGRAAALLTKAAERASSKKATLKALGQLADLAASEIGRAAGLDALAPLRSLALAEPKKGTRWKRLREAAGEERLGDALDALMMAFDEASETDNKLRHDLLLQACEIAESADDGESAASYARMALDERDDDSTRARMHALMRRNGEHEELAIDLESQAESKPKRAVALLEEALGVWLDHAGNAERGMAVLDRLLELAPKRSDLADRRLDVMRLNGHDGYDEALTQAIDAAREAKDKARLAGLLPRLLRAQGPQLEPAARFALLSELADLSASTAALAAFVDDMAADADALDPEQAKLVFQWLLDNVDPVAEPARYAAARLQQLVGVEDATQQLTILDELVQHAQERLQDPDSAVEWAARSLLLAPGDDDRVQRLLTLVETEEQASTALPALQASLELRDDDNRPSAETLLRVLELGPGEEGTWRLIVERLGEPEFCAVAATQFVPVLRGAGQHAWAADVLQRQADHLPEADRGPALLALAGTMADALGQPAEAVSLLLRSAGSVDGADELVGRSLELARAHEALAEWLVGVEQAVAEGQLEGPSATVAVAMAAHVATDDLDDPARAAELWTRLWDLHPGDDDARDAVLAHRRAAEDSERLAVDLERAVIQGGEGADELNIELAELYHQHLNRSREALSSVRTVLRKEPGHAGALALAEALAEVEACRRQALSALEQALRATESWPRLATTLQRIVEAASGRQRVKALQSLAALQQDRLDQPGEALQALTHALELQPTGPLLEKAVALAREHGSAETPARLFDLALNGDLPASDRADALAAAAEHYHFEREDLERAESLWQQLLQAEPTHAAAFDGLDAIYESSDRWDELLALLEQRLRAARGTDAEASILHRLGGIAQAVQRNDVAIDAFEQLARLEPGNPEHLETAAELLRSARNPRKLVDVLERLGEVLKEPSAKARALTEAGHLCASRLDDAARAERLFVQAFELDPAGDEAYRWLEKRHADRPQRLAKLYKHRSTGVESGARRTRVLRKLAAVFNGLGRAAQAKAVLLKAREDDPDNSAIDDDLLALTRDAGDREGFEAVAARRLAANLGPVERADLLVQLTKMALAHYGDAAKWLDQLRKAAPDHAELATLEGQLQVDSGDPEQAVQGLERLLESASDDAQRVDALRRIAEIQQEKLNKPIRAIAAYQRILKLDPTQHEVQQKLADLFAARGSVEALVETLRQWLGHIDDGAAQVPVMAQLAKAQLELGDKAAALKTLESAYELDRNHLTVNRLLAAALAEDGAAERAVELQQWVVDRLRRQRQKAELPEAATTAGRLLAQLGQHKQAQRFYRMALHADRSWTDATIGLGLSYLELTDVTRAMAELEKVARLSKNAASAEQRAAAQVGLGRCWLSKGKGAQARAAFNKALTIEPGNKDALQLLNQT